MAAVQSNLPGRPAPRTRGVFEHNSEFLAMELGEDVDTTGERRRIAIITGANGYISFNR